MSKKWKKKKYHKKNYKKKSTKRIPKYGSQRGGVRL